MKRRIDRYKVSCWYHRDRNVPVFGIKVRVDGSWFNLAEAGRALFFDERRDAEAKIQALKEHGDENNG